MPSRVQSLESRRLLCAVIHPDTPPLPGSGTGEIDPGPMTALVIPTVFADTLNPSDPARYASLPNQLTWVNDQFIRNSFGKFSFDFTISPIVTVRSEASYAPYAQGNTQILQEARDLSNSNANPQYRASSHTKVFVIALTSSVTLGAEGVAFLGGYGAVVERHRMPDLSQARPDSAALHELTHTLGATHAGLYRPGKDLNLANDVSPNAGAGATEEYGDTTSYMGGNPSTRDISIIEKRALGWLDDATLPTASSSDDFTIYAHDQGGALDANKDYGLAVPFVSGKKLWVEYRLPIAVNGQTETALNSSFTSFGVQIRWTEYLGVKVGAEDSVSGTGQLDMNPAHVARIKLVSGSETQPTVFPGAQNSMLDGALTVGQSFTDPGGQVTITTTEVGTDVNGKPYAKVHVHFGPKSAVPVVVALNTPLGKLNANQPISFSASVTDSDTATNQLSYLWEVQDVLRGWRRVLSSNANTPAITIGTVASGIPTSVDGQYQVMLRVSDRTGNVVTTTRNFEIKSGIANPFPFALISGRVVDKNGNGVMNVNVVGVSISNGSLFDSTMTDVNGYYSMPRAGSDYNIVALHTDYSIDTIEDQAQPISNAARTRVDFVAVPRFVKLSGIVTGQVGDGRFTISVGSYQTKSDRDGNWQIEVPAGRYGISASGTGQSILVTGNGWADATGLATNGPLIEAGGIVGRDLTVGLTGFTPPTPLVEFFSSFGSDTNAGSVITPSSLTLTNFVNVGRVYVWVKRAGSNSWSTSNHLLTIPDTGSIPTVTFTRNATATSAIYGRVIGANGPWNSGTAQLYKVEPTGATALGLIDIDDNGFYYFPGLAGGEYYVVATRSGVSKQTTTVTLGNADKTMDDLIEPAAPSTPTVTQQSVSIYGALYQLSASSTGQDVSYEWQVVTLPPIVGATVSFNKNKTQNANVVEARFSHAGTYTLQVRAIDRFGQPSASWRPVEVVVGTIADKIKPKLRRAGFAYLTTEQAFEFQFTESVHDNAGGLPSILVEGLGGSITITSLFNGYVFTQDDFDTAWDVKTNTLRLTPYEVNESEPNLQFADGIFAVTVMSRFIFDDANNQGASGNFSGAYDSDIFILGGDATHDGLVNFDDLLIVAQNYLLSSRNWSTGDFNYDGICNFDDLLILAQNWGSSWQGEDLDGDGDSDIADFVISLSEE